MVHIKRSILSFASTLILIFSTGFGQSVKAGGIAPATVRGDPADRQSLDAFMDEQLECERYVFPPGKFPLIRWKREMTVEHQLGKFPLKVTYYDREMHPVSIAERTGRYAAMIEGETPSGFVVKRYVTLYCAPVDFDDYSRSIPLRLNPLEAYGIPRANWDLYSEHEARFAFGSMKLFPQHDPDAAIFLAGLSEMDSVESGYDTPRLRDRQWWITFKYRVMDTDVPFARLGLPRVVQNDVSRRLDTTVAATSDFTLQDLENIRTICRKGVETCKEPFVTLIVHKGRVVFHEAFGTTADGSPEDRNSTKWMASITKLLTGALMMQFVDRGIVDLDAPLARYLPELPRAVNGILTMRHLFTHTSGLDRAGEWASDWNPALENQVSQILPKVLVGESFSYNRVGYALAGKVMERLTGRAVPYLFQDYIFSPLGMNTAYSENTYGGLYCTALDLARLGQMLLNKGTYYGHIFFSEESYRKMLPVKLTTVDRRWGIGTSPMGGHGLSDESWGHAAASGALFRIDPARDLIIISARNSIGPSSALLEEFDARLIEACTAPFFHH